MNILEELRQYKEYLIQNKDNSILDTRLTYLSVAINNYLTSYLETEYGMQFSYTPHTFETNEFITDLFFTSIPQTLENIKAEAYNFNNWIDLKKYIDKITITYDELINIIDDIFIAINNREDIANHNIWNYIYLLNWNEDSTIEWEE